MSKPRERSKSVSSGRPRGHRPFSTLRRRIIWFAASIVIVGGGVSVRAAPSDSKGPDSDLIANVFKPFQTDCASLSPDGTHLAYEVRKNDRLFLDIVDLDTRKFVELPLISDEAVPLSGISEKLPMHLTYLKWANANRLVACIRDEVLFAVNADGSHFKVLLNDLKLKFITQAIHDTAQQGKPPPGPNFDASLPNDGVPLPTTSNGGNASGDVVVQNPPVADVPSDTGPDNLVNGNSTGFTGSTRALDTTNGSGPTDDLFSEGDDVSIIPAVRAHVLDILPSEPDYILVEALSRAGPLDDSATPGQPPAPNAYDITSSVFKLNIDNGSTKAQDDELRTSRIICDKQGNARIALRHFDVDRNFVIALKPGGRFVPISRAFGKKADAPDFDVKPTQFFDHRAIPIGFGYDPSTFYYASDVGRDTFGIFGIDLKTGRKDRLSVVNSQVDMVDFSDLVPEHVLVFDRFEKKLVGIRVPGVLDYTRWIDPKLEAIQQKLNEASPGQQVRIMEWDANRDRFLLFISGHTNPGAYYVYDREQGKLDEYAQRAPWIAQKDMNLSEAFRIRTQKGVTLSGYLTVPRKPRTKPIPLLVYCHDGPWNRDYFDYNRGVQALASMGFAVLQMNYRGSSGFGADFRDALKKGYDTVALDDILSGVDWAQQHFPISHKLVAILGNGYGGFLALRALELHGDRFRCGVSINAPTNLPKWLNYPTTAFCYRRGIRQTFFGKHNSAELLSISPAKNADELKKPVLIIQGAQDAIVPESQGREMMRALAGSKTPHEFFDLSYEGHSHWLPGSYTKVFDKLELFFNTYIYNYGGQMGEPQVLETLPADKK